MRERLELEFTNLEVQRSFVAGFSSASKLVRRLLQQGLPVVDISETLDSFAVQMELQEEGNGISVI